MLTSFPAQVAMLMACCTALGFVLGWTFTQHMLTRQGLLELEDRIKEHIRTRPNRPAKQRVTIDEVRSVVLRLTGYVG